MIRVTEEWKKTWPQAHVGVMAVGGIERAISGESLTEKKRVLTRTLGERYRKREDLLSDEIISAYVAYFKKYKKTYHVLMQLESVIFKGKSLPSVSPLVESMFMAELESAILTAGHDADALQDAAQPVRRGRNGKIYRDWRKRNGNQSAGYGDAGWGRSDCQRFGRPGRQNPDYAADQPMSICCVCSAGNRKRMPEGTF